MSDQVINPDEQTKAYWTGFATPEYATFTLYRVDEIDIYLTDIGCTFTGGDRTAIKLALIALKMLRDDQSA